MNHFSGVLKVKILNVKIEEAFNKISYTYLMLKTQFFQHILKFKTGFLNTGKLS